MIRSLLMGAVAGMRAMTPFAAVANAARLGALPKDNGAPVLLAHPLVSTGALAIAGGELFGDKLPSSPDRIVAPGLAARLVTGALAGAALAPRKQRTTAALVGAGAAVAASYLTWRVRCAAMARYGQTGTGLVEDAITVGSAVLIVRGARRSAA